MKVQSTCAGLMLVAGLISVNASANQNRVSAQTSAEIVGCTDPAISGVARLIDSDGSIIYGDPDTFCPDGPVPGCAGGARVACGIIEPVENGP
jgi:hypothetical protein